MFCCRFLQEVVGNMLQQAHGRIVRMLQQAELFKDVGGLAWVPKVCVGPGQWRWVVLGAALSSTQQECMLLDSLWVGLLGCLHAANSQREADQLVSTTKC